MSGLGIQHPAYYKWLKSPVSAREIEERELIGKLHELHEEDSEGGYRVLADDLEDAGYQVSERRVWRLCRKAGDPLSDQQTPAQEHVPAGPAVHDDLVQRNFTADQPNQLWLTDITRTPHERRKAVPVRD